MTRMIQIRNVPEDIHRALKVRAAQAGMSLSGYLLQEIRKIAEHPTMEEMIQRLRSREALRDDIPTSDIIRRVREE